ncbi:MAG: hypothetical protein ACYC6A_07760 [Armatimonadota bacterium]
MQKLMRIIERIAAASPVFPGIIRDPVSLSLPESPAGCWLQRAEGATPALEN